MTTGNGTGDSHRSHEQTQRDALLRQQAALAEFGELALKRDNLDAVLHEGCRLVGEALGTELAKIITVEDEGATFFVRAGIGWKANVAGKLRFAAEEDSADCYALASGEPVIVTNIREEKRFRIAGFVLEEGVKAFVNVPIIGADGQPCFGILEVDSRTPRRFDESDISFLRTYANMMAAAVARQRTLAELRKLAEQRMWLLNELQHRLKNNLQSVSALIDLTIGNATDPAMKSVLRSLSGRVDSLRLVHERIYASQKFEEVELASYLGELAAALLRSNQTEQIRISLQSDLKPLIVSPDIAFPLGLIATEFITNSIKHAFERDGTISLRLDRPDPALARIVLSDNGRGFAHRNTTGTGMRLIANLATQANADIHWRSRAGTELSLVFPVDGK